MADEADYKFWGQAIEDEEESRLGQRRKDVRDPAATRALPLHKQEVTDEEGRRRFHGAFTGGYSAGYFNTVSSKGGWQPGTFRSSRDSREAVQQSVEQYLDEDELEELRRTNLQTSAEYDTFGSTAAELARRAATDAATERPSAIPGLLPDELVVPMADSVGIRLLQKMGWRLGKGIGVGGDAPTPDDETAEQQQAGSAGGSGDGATAAAAAATARRKRRWGQHVSVAAENTALHLLAPKTDVHGLGFDPFKGAEEFRRLKEQRQAAARPGAAAAGGGQAGKRRRGIAFGSGALDDENEDGYGAGVTLEDYVTHDDVGDYDAEVEVGAVSRSRAPKLRRSGLGDRLAQKGYSFEIAEEEEEEEQGALEWHQPHRQPQYALPGRAAPLLLHSKEQAQGKSGLVPGFVRATVTVAFTYFPPPSLPPNYVPVHRVRQTPPEAEAQRPSAALAPAPPQAPPPADAELRQAIDSLAFFVARNGLIFENMARQRQEKEGRHAFLSGGLGADYYRWRVHSLRAIIQPQQQQQQQQQRRRKQPLAIGQRSAPLSADERGAMLGEQPLAAATAGAAAAGPEGWATGVPEGQQAAAAAIAAGQAQQALRRQLLQVAEGDRQRLQQLLSRNFVAAETQDMLHPDAKAAAMSGLRPGAPAPPPRLPAGTAAERAAAAAAAAAAGATPAGAAAEAAGGGLALRVQRPAAQQGPAQRQLPVRRSEEWRPQALLCKRFNVPDPYQGRPAELQMSRFRTDHLVLPDTAAAVASSLTAVPDGAQDFLLPPSVATAIKEAEAKQQLQFMQGSGGGAMAAEQPAAQPQDAAGAADAFLSSLSDMLGGAGGGSGGPAAAGNGSVAPPLPPGLPPPLDPLQQQQQQQQEEEAAAREEEEAEEAVAERPVDLFKAIFEDSEEEEEEEEEVEAQERQLGQQPAAAALATADGADHGGGLQAGRQQQAQQQQQQQGQHANATFGFAKLRQQGRPPPLPPPLPMLPPPPRSGAVPAAAAAAVAEGGLDEATKLRVQEALRALGKGSKRDKRSGSKKKKKGKEKEKERKERKEKKASRHKSSKHKRHSRRGSNGSGSSSDGSDSD